MFLSFHVCFIPLLVQNLTFISIYVLCIMFSSVAYLRTSVPLVCKFHKKCNHVYPPAVSQLLALHSLKPIVFATSWLPAHSYPQSTLECRIQWKGKKNLPAKVRIWPDVDCSLNSQTTGGIHVCEKAHRECEPIVSPTSRRQPVGCCPMSVSTQPSGSQKVPAWFTWPVSVRRQQLLPCWSSGSIAKGVAVWFVGKRQGRKKKNGYCIR